MYRMKLELSAVRGALVRLLGVAERRGFEPTSVVCTTIDATMRVEMTVNGRVDVGLLVRQLLKLHDVRTVEVCS